MRTRILAIATCSVALAWAQPSPRAYVPLAYDAASELFVLYGGQLGVVGDVSDETWVYDARAGAWQRRSPAESPPALNAHALAYDAGSDRVVLFGGAGRDSRPRDELWSYDVDADTWTKHQAAGPPGRGGARMAYDAGSDRVVLYGGRGDSGQLLNDTWLLDLDAETWTRVDVEPSPPKRVFHQMAYDAATDRVVLWGGDIRPYGAWGILWTFDTDTRTWTEHDEVTEPISVYYGRMAAPPDGRQALLFGGGPTGSDATWRYRADRDRWREIDATHGPGVRSRFAMAASNEGVLVFGGQIGPSQYAYENDTWWFDWATDRWSPR